MTAAAWVCIGLMSLVPISALLKRAWEWVDDEDCRWANETAADMEEG